MSLVFPGVSPPPASVSRRGRRMGGEPSPAPSGITVRGAGRGAACKPGHQGLNGDLSRAPRDRASGRGGPCSGCRPRAGAAAGRGARPGHRRPRRDPEARWRGAFVSSRDGECALPGLGSWPPGLRPLCVSGSPGFRSASGDSPQPCMRGSLSWLCPFVPLERPSV